MSGGQTVRDWPSGLPAAFPMGRGRQEPSPARRIMIVSADIGGGHHATGKALEERVHELWPRSTIEWLDTLAAMGPGVGAAFRRIYVTNVEVTPWLYQFFYASLWRHRWFATASKRFVAGWAGRRLAGTIEAFDPDLVLSTYPLGSAGLAWLRERRGLGAPTGAWVSDFAPHPLWVYPQLDLTLVVHPGAVPSAMAAGPGSVVGVSPPPVLRRFHPGDAVDARRRLGLDLARPVVLLTSGALGFGAVEEAVRVLTMPTARRALVAPLHVVVVCGRNRELALRLTALRLPADRLTVLGWVDDMPDLLRAADALVTNAGGATALEAMATGTPMVMYRPIAAHGAANAALLTAVGLAETCSTPAALAATVHSLVRSRQPASAPPALLGPPDLGLQAVADSRPAAPVQAGRLRRPPGWPLRSQDAFFLHVQTPTVAQQVGSVLELGPTAAGRPLGRPELVELLRRRLPVMVTLRRRLVPGGAWRRPRWAVVPELDPEAHVDERRLPAGDDPQALAAALDDFWSEPVRLDTPPWRMLLVTGLDGGRSVLAVKVHHSLGDGLSVIGTLTRLLDRLPLPGEPAPGPVNAAVTAPAPSGARMTKAPRRRALPVRLRARLAETATAARGLSRLAAAGRAPRTAMNHRLATPRRHLSTTAFSAARVNRAARAAGVHASEIICTLAAEAFRVTYPGAPVPDSLRAQFAVSRRPRERWRTYGNWTGAVALDLPLRPMPATARAALIRDRLRGSVASGQPLAAALVMRGMGTLPTPVHGWLARQVYSSRFTNVIVSYLPGTRHAVAMAGSPCRTAVPVLALADGVPIAVGAMRWADTIGVGVLLDASLAAVGDAFVAAMHAGLDDLLASEEPSPWSGPTSAASGHAEAP